MPGAAFSVSLPSALHLAVGEAAHAVFRRRIRVDTSRTDRTEADAQGERKPLTTERGEKCGLARPPIRFRQHALYSSFIPDGPTSGEEINDK